MIRHDWAQQPYFKSILEMKPETLKPDTLWIRKKLLKSQKVIVDTSEFVNWMEENEFSEVTEIPDKLELYTPFKCLWIEFFDMKTKNPLPVDMQNELTNTTVAVLGIGYDLETHEIFTLVSTSKNPKLVIPFVKRLKLGDENNVFEDELLMAATNYLKTEYVNAVTTSFAFGKPRTGKPLAHVSAFVIVYRRQPIKKTESDNYENGNVEWEHRWHVRGHWRQVRGIGHDAEGNEMEGWTWVKSHVKGPEDKPLVEKIKIVKDSLPPCFKRA